MPLNLCFHKVQNFLNIFFFNFLLPILLQRVKIRCYLVHRTIFFKIQILIFHLFYTSSIFILSSNMSNLKTKHVCTPDVRS